MLFLCYVYGCVDGVTMALTDSKIRALKAKDKDYYVWHNAGTRGGGVLGIRIYPSGSKRFVYQHSEGGRRKILVIGEYPKMSLADAAQRVRELSAAPDKSSATSPAGATFKELVRDYIDNQKQTGKRSWKVTENRLNQVLDSPHINPDTPAANITTRMVFDVLADFIQRGAVAGSDKVRGNLHALFNFALSADHDPAKRGFPARYNMQLNPVTVIPKQTGGGRALDRYLSWGELYQFIDSVTVADMACPMTPLYARALMLCIYTGGQRPWEIITLKKSDVNEKEKTLTIRPEISKTLNFHVVPLMPEALEIIRIQLILYPDSEMLFPAPTEAGHVLSAELSKQVRKYCKREEFAPFTPRDLRRTFKTLAGEMGINIEIRDILQNHKRPGVSGKHYDRYYYLKEKREALEVWCSRLVSRQ